MTRNEPKPAEWTWMFSAGCRGLNADLFFPGPDADPAPAKAICSACPVRVACLSFALDQGERFGIWGGLDEKERGRLSVEERKKVHEAARTAA